MTPSLTPPESNPQQQLNNLKFVIVAGGGLLGAVVGAVASRLFIRSDEAVLERDRQRGPKGIGFSPSVLLPLAITLIGLIREIGGLGDKKTEKE